MTRVLYFTDDFSPENISKAKDAGVFMRDTRAYNPDDFIETCDAVCGDVPDGYKYLPTHDMTDAVDDDQVPPMPQPATLAAIMKVLTKAGVPYADDDSEVTLRKLYDEHNLYPKDVVTGIAGNEVLPQAEALSIDDMKAEMTAAGHEYNTRLGDVKITETYNEFKAK